MQECVNAEMILIFAALCLAFLQSPHSYFGRAPITLDTTMASSRGSTGLATHMRKPAASARSRSSLRPKAVRAMAGICFDCGTPCSASHSLTF